MTSKNSSTNPNGSGSIYLSGQLDISQSQSILAQVWRITLLGIRKNQAVAVTSILLMIIGMPVVLLMLPGQSFSSITIEEMFRYLMGIPLLVITTVFVVIIAGAMFSYLHNKTSLDVYHALPVKRSVLFAGRFLGGLIMILVPQALAFLSVLIMSLFPKYNQLSSIEVVNSGLIFILLSLALYTVSVMSFVLSGNRFDAMMLLLMFNIAWPATLYVIDSTTSRILPGFSINNYNNAINIDRYLALSPFGELLKASFLSIKTNMVIWWVAIIVVILLSSLLIYMRRPTELAGKPLAYRIPFLVIRFILCLIVGMILGSLYYDLFSKWYGFIFATVISTLAVHTLIEIIFSRGFKNFLKSLVSYGVFAVIFALGFISITTGFFGFDTRIPDVNKVNSVQFVYSSSDFNFNFDLDLENNGYIFKDQANIQRIIEINRLYLQKIQSQIHKPYSLSTNEQLSLLNRTNDLTETNLHYKLNDGSTFIRAVYLNLNEEPFASVFDEIKKTEEFKRQYYMIFYEENKLSKLEIDNKTGKQILTLNEESDQEQMQQLLNALKADILANADTKDDSKFLGNLHMIMRFKTIDATSNYITAPLSMKITDAYTNLLNVLSQYELMADFTNVN